MFITATILYFGESPVGYDLFKYEKGFEFRPTQMTASEVTPPQIVVTKVNDAWQIQGTKNEDAKEQVMKLIKMNEVIDLRGELSAAS